MNDNLARIHDRLRRASPLHGSGGSGTYGDMSEQRLTALETHFEYARRDMDTLKAGQERTNEKLEQIATTLGTLPTRSDLWAWKIQYTAISLAAVALIVGGIIGGLGWLRP